jgi:hypothetical protein
LAVNLAADHLARAAFLLGSGSLPASSPTASVEERSLCPFSGPGFLPNQVRRKTHCVLMLAPSLVDG